MRDAFQDAHGAGLGITEYEPDGKGAQEVHELWRWIERKMGKLSHEPQAHVRSTSILAPPGPSAEAVAAPPPAAKPASLRPGVKQQTVYLPLAVYEQLRRWRSRSGSRCTTCCSRAWNACFATAACRACDELRRREQLTRSRRVVAVCADQSLRVARQRRGTGTRQISSA